MSNTKSNDIFERLNKYFNNEKNYIFRGCVDEGYILLPSLYRDNCHNCDEEHKRFLEFLLKKRKNTIKHDDNFLRYLAAQHYGCKTKLLDFTHSIDTALFFATHSWPNGELCLDENGVLYIIELKNKEFEQIKLKDDFNTLLFKYLNNYSTENNEYYIIDLTLKKIKKGSFDPRERIKRQKGCFVYFSTCIELPKDYFTKITLPKCDKKRIKDYLDKKGITIKDFI